MTNKTPNVYMLECGNAKSSWKVSETALFNECKQWDRHLFTRDDILSLQAQLSATAAGFRIPPEIRIYPDFHFSDQYGTSVGIQIGAACVSFIPVYGSYGQR